MNRRSLLQAGLAAAGAIAGLFAFRSSRAQNMMQSQGGMGGMMGGDMGDIMGPMQLGMQPFRRHSEFHRTVMFLPDGVRAVTESDDPKAAALI